MGAIKDFIIHHYRHFNAAALVDAARGWENHLDQGGKMLLTVGGAMSTAEMGLSMAELIRQDKVHALCVTGANLEEDLFNLVAHSQYKRVPHYRSLTLADEQMLYDGGFNRVTDTCIPEEQALRRIDYHMVKLWTDAEAKGERYFPYEYMYQLLRSGVVEGLYEIDPRDSWLLAACEKNLPIWSPGWEDSSLGNIFVARAIEGKIKRFDTVKGGLERMTRALPLPP